MRAISPIVTTEWLAEHLDEPGLVVIDTRSPAAYAAGHIPGGLSMPFPEAAEQPTSQWFVERDGLMLEVPEADELFDTIGSAGIEAGSRVVVVAKAELPHPLVDATRVADTLMYAGVKNVAVLDGGHDRWAAEGRRISTDVSEPVTTPYTGTIDETMFVGKEYVEESIGKAVIIDTREPLEYFGGSLRPVWTRPGHIPTAKCLPSLWLWDEDLTYRSAAELGEMAAGVIGPDLSREVVIYCGVGGFSSAWYFVLREVLGYQDVKIYHGSAQEWTRDPHAPLVSYRWE
ncbi:MAG: sulfurtransferase [Thermoleophilia bacterium]|nr:sulfurtransferase [Thermoleophilia bacterium]